MTVAAPVKLGLRERSKRDRRLRIEAAALAVFHEKGYDAATTREIAERADVGVATLFAYARDKHDLLMMVFNVRLETITEESAETIDLNAPLLDQLIHLFRPRYVVWGEDPHLSRYAVQQSFTVPQRQNDAPSQVARFIARRARLHDAIVALVVRKQESGHVKRSVDPQLVAGLVIDIFLSETRQWLMAEAPQLDAGLDRLRRVLALAAAGFDAE